MSKMRTDTATAANWLSLGPWIRTSAPFLVLIGLVALIGILKPGFVSIDTLVVVMADTATLFILAAGVTFVVMLGGIDLSNRAGYWAFPAALLAGLAIGCFSGIVHVWLRIPSFIVTLATSGLAAAAALVMSQGRSITIGDTGRSFLSWIIGRFFGVPNVIIVAAAVGGIGILAQCYTAFGRYSTAIGAGEAATWASGVAVNHQKVIAYALSAMLAALAGILLAGRLSSGSPTLATELLLPAIAAVVVGGTAITGGAGGIGRTAIGALIISVVRVGMTFIGVNIFAQQIVFGAVLIMAVAATIDRTKVLIVK